MNSIEFLQWYRPGGPWVLTSISTDKKSMATRTFDDTSLGALTGFLQENAGKNVYFQVNPAMRELRKKADREDVKELAWLHVDIDPRAGEDIASEQARALKLLQAPPSGIPAPSVIVFSGGGYQGFWRLKEPLPINGILENAEEAKRYNQALELAFGADHCHNVDRIMRLPGTMNVPDAKKRAKGRTEVMATVVEVHDDRVYDLSQFTAAPKTQIGSLGGFANNAPSSRGGAQVGVRVSGNVSRLTDLSELDEWNVPDRVKVIIVQGSHPDETKQGDNSRSAWVFDCVCQLARCKVPDDVIFSIMTDPDFGIAESIIEKGQNAERYAIRQIERAKEHIIEPMLREFNERFAIIGNMGGKCRVVEELTDEVLHRARLTRQSFEDFRNRWARVPIQFPNPKEPSEKISIPAGKWWLTHPQARYYDSMAFNPKGDKDGVYNLWRGYGVRPMVSDAHEIFLNHTLNIICSGNESHYDYVIRWLARMVQQPWTPGEVAIVLRGGMGVGKGAWASWIMRLFGQHSLQVTNPAHLVGNFNSHLRDCVFLFADEAFYAGDKKHESILKTLITERSIMIEGKGVDVEMYPNVIHILMASNNQWVVPAGMDERRYLVLDVSDAKKRDTEYFGKFMETAKAGGVEALLQYLMTLPLDGYNVRVIPQTAALQEQKLLSMSDIDEWWYTKLQRGAVLSHHERWNTIVRCSELVEDYVQHARDVGIMRRATPTALGKFLRRAMPDGFPHAHQRATEIMERDEQGWEKRVIKRLRHYEIPTLEVCRARFQERFGFAGEWEPELPGTGPGPEAQSLPPDPF